jgi:hypothetical protein
MYLAHCVCAGVPGSAASLYIAMLKALPIIPINAGNSLKPQIRAEHFVPMGRDRIIVQGALSDAIASNFTPPTNTTVSNTPSQLLIVTENTGIPNIEARVA